MSETEFKVMTRKEWVEMAREFIEPCGECGARPEERTCDECDAIGVLVDCGHQAQPRPIAAGRRDGTEMHRTFCGRCACEGSERSPEEI